MNFSQTATLNRIPARLLESNKPSSIGRDINTRRLKREQNVIVLLEPTNAVNRKRPPFRAAFKAGVMLRS
jgi:hypothetical protein